MAERNEIVRVELNSEARLRLYSQITGQMEKLGFNPMDYSSLDLGIELPANWPVDVNSQPTLPELVVIAMKLKMFLVIGDVNAFPQK